MILIRADGDLCQCQLPFAAIYSIEFIINIELYYSDISDRIMKVTNRNLLEKFCSNNNES